MNISANVKPHTPTIPNKPDEPLRHDLGLAIRARDAAAAKRDAAADILERAHSFVLELEERLQSAAERDAAAIRERAGHFKAALREATTPTVSTSAKLCDASLQRLEAENAVSAAWLAHKALGDELAAAESHLVACEAAVTGKAMAIVGAYADRLAQELREAEHATAMLRRRLLGATQLRPGGQFPLSRETMTVARGDNRETFSHAEPSDTVHFNIFLAALCRDANAQPGE